MSTGALRKLSTAQKAGVPAEITVKTRPRIALEQIRRAYEAGIAPGVVLMDAGYGADTDLRDDITASGLTYAAGIGPATGLRRDGEHAPDLCINQRLSGDLFNGPNS